MEEYSGICNFCNNEKENLEVNEFEGTRVYICEECKSNPSIYNIHMAAKAHLTPLKEETGEG